jgi:hypothetical protein
MKIAIMTPSRGRPKELYRFFDSVNSTISRQNMLYFLIGIDSDDPSKSYYYDVYRSMQRNANDNVIVTLVEEQRRAIGFIWNELARMKGWSTSPDMFIMGNDDLLYLTQDWDVLLQEEIMKSDHPFYCYWFDDGINGESHCAFPIVTKHWVGALGYFVPEIFKFFYHDTWVFDVAKKANCLKYLPEIKTKHLHFSQPNVPTDSTYAYWRQGTVHQDDTKLFNSKEEDRARTADYLQQRILNWKKLKETIKNGTVTDSDKISEGK